MQNYMHSSPSFRVVSVHVTATKRECNISGMTKNYSCIKENINQANNILTLCGLKEKYP